MPRLYCYNSAWQHYVMKLEQILYALWKLHSFYVFILWIGYFPLSQQDTDHSSSSNTPQSESSMRYSHIPGGVPMFMDNQFMDNQSYGGKQLGGAAVLGLHIAAMTKCANYVRTTVAIYSRTLQLYCKVQRLSYMWYVLFVCRRRHRLWRLCIVTKWVKLIV